MICRCFWSWCVNVLVCVVTLKSAHFTCFATFDSAARMRRDSFIHDRPRPTDHLSQVLSRAAISFLPCDFHIDTFVKTLPLHSANLCRGFKTFPWECAPLLCRSLLASRQVMSPSLGLVLCIAQDSLCHTSKTRESFVHSRRNTVIVTAIGHDHNTSTIQSNFRKSIPKEESLGTFAEAQIILNHTSHPNCLARVDSLRALIDFLWP